MWETIVQLKDPVIFLVVGMFLLVKGADWFVDGASNIAKLLKIPSLIIGLTLVSMGTSAPEASVSIQAAISASNDISIGNVVGSNIFNVLVVVGLSAFFAPMVIDKQVKVIDLPMVIGISVLLVLFSFVITPFVLDTIESIIMLTLFIIYIVLLVVRSCKKKGGCECQLDSELLKEEEKKEKPKVFKSIFLAVIGLLAIIVGGDWVVDGASSIALKLGMDEILVGLTIVAVGTSLPELVTSIVAAKKHENDIAIGNIIGSNIFNILFILGLSSTICNLTVSMPTLVDMLVMTFAVLMLFIFSLFKEKVGFKQGLVIFLSYIIYLAFIIVRNYAL